MQIFSIVILGLLIVDLLMVFRNHQVFKERTRFLKIVSDRAKESINKGEDWRHHYDLLDDSSYNEMLLKFWKPVKSFYKNK